MDEWRYEPTEDFDQAPVERLKNFPRQPDMLVFAGRSVAHLVMRGLLRIYNRLEIVGRENLPQNDSFVLVANHSSHLDAITLLSCLPISRIHRAFPAAASDYFFTSVTRVVFSAIVVNAMPFDRKENPRQSLELCRQLLETPGHVLVLFPEGTRTLDGTIGQFKPGIGLITAGTSVPVVPCYLRGAYEAWPKGRWFPRPHKLLLTIGPPMSFKGLTSSRENAIMIADSLREDVDSLRRQTDL